MSRLTLIREQLAVKYRSSLKAEAIALRAEIEALDTRISDIHERAHNLQGSGGTFGFDGVTEAASLMVRANIGEFRDRVEALADTVQAVADGES